MLQQPICLAKPYSAMMQIPNDLFFAWVESEIADGRSVQFRLKGVSMFPLIRNGKDEVMLRPCSAETKVPEVPAPELIPLEALQEDAPEALPEEPTTSSED